MSQRLPTWRKADAREYILRTARASQGIGNLAAWDLGMGLYAAGLAGADTSAWIDGVKAEIDELDGAAYYDVVGLAGAILGLASVGEDYDPTTGEHATAGSLSDLGDILASDQIDGGGFAWNSDYVIAGDDNEAIQETAYSALALFELDKINYVDDILGARWYLQSSQLATADGKTISAAERTTKSRAKQCGRSSPSRHRVPCC